MGPPRNMTDLISIPPPINCGKTSCVCRYNWKSIGKNKIIKIASLYTFSNYCLFILQLPSKCFSDLPTKTILILYFPKWQIHQNVKIPFQTVRLVVGAQTDTAWLRFGDNLQTHGTAVMLVRSLLSFLSLAFQDETKQTVRPTSVEHFFSPVKSDFRLPLQHDSLTRGSELQGTFWGCFLFCKNNKLVSAWWIF